MHSQHKWTIVLYLNGNRSPCSSPHDTVVDAVKGVKVVVTNILTKQGRMILLSPVSPFHTTQGE